MSLLRVDPNQFGHDSQDGRGNPESSSALCLSKDPASMQSSINISNIPSSSSQFSSFRKQQPHLHHYKGADGSSAFHNDSAGTSNNNSAALSAFAASSQPSSLMLMLNSASMAAAAEGRSVKTDGSNVLHHPPPASSSTPAPPPDNQMVWDEVKALQGQVKQLSQKLSNERVERRKLREGFDLLKEMYSYQSAAIIRLERKANGNGNGNGNPNSTNDANATEPIRANGNAAATNATSSSRFAPSSSSSSSSALPSSSSASSSSRPSDSPTDSHIMFRSTPSVLVGPGPMMSSNVGSHIKASVSSSEGSALIRRNSSLRLAGDGSFRPVFDSSSRPPSALSAVHHHDHHQQQSPQHSANQRQPRQQQQQQQQQQRPRTGEGSSLVRRSDSFQLSGDGSLRIVGDRSRRVPAPTATANPAAIQCDVRKIDGKLGLGLAGGDGADSLPLHVCDVPPGGAAAVHGGISVGDRVLTIDGIDMFGAVYTDAVDALMASGNVVRLELLRDPQLRTQLEAANKHAAVAAAIARSQASSVASNRDNYAAGSSATAALATAAATATATTAAEAATNNHLLDDLYDDQVNERRGKAAARDHHAGRQSGGGGGGGGSGSGSGGGGRQEEFKCANFGPELSPIRASSSSSSSPRFSDQDVESQSTPPRASTPPTEGGAAAGAAAEPEEPEGGVGGGVLSGHVHSFVCGRLAARGYTARCEANDAERVAAESAAEGGGGGGGASGIGPSPIMTFDDEMLSPGLSPVLWGEAGTYSDGALQYDGAAAATAGAGAGAATGSSWASSQHSPDEGVRSSSTGSDPASPEEEYGHMMRMARHARSGESGGGAAVDSPAAAAPHRARLPSAGTPKVVRDRDLPGMRRSSAYCRTTREDLLENPFNSPRLRRKGNRRAEVTPTDFAARVLGQPIEELQPITSSSSSASASSTSYTGGGGGVVGMQRGENGADAFGEAYAGTIPEVLYAEFGTLNTLLSVVVLKEAGRSLGITISGGTTVSPKPGIFVMSVTAGGAVAREGTLRPQDRILSVDRIDMRNANRTDAVSVLKNVGTEVYMVVARMRAVGPPPTTRL